MSSPASQVRDIFQIYCRHLQEEFDVALAHVKHPGEKGIARERVLERHLRRFLPQRYDIGTGFVVDAMGGVSRQIDLILYDRVSSPKFDVGGGLTYFPAECVVAVGEVKSTVENRATMTDALAKLGSVKRLDRFANRDRFDGSIHGAHGEIASRVPTNGKMPVPYRVCSFLFTSSSMRRNVVVEALRAYCDANERAVWPNMYVDMNHYLISYISDDDYLTMYPEESKGLYSTKDDDSGNTILLYTSLLYRHLRVARVQDPDLMTYFSFKETDVDRYIFENGPAGGDSGVGDPEPEEV